MKEASHRTRVLQTSPTTAYPVCSCGWLGKERHPNDMASLRQEANAHFVGTLKKVAP